MATAADPITKIKEQATCSICLELLQDPVTTECGHSFCELCIALHHEGREDFVCPQCRRWLQKRNLRPNRELKYIAEILRSQTEGKPAEGNMCKRHRQPLQLYCKEHQTPICVVCRESQVHRGHTVVPVEEAVQEYRGKIAEQLGVIESSCWKLHQFVNQIWKHLSENEQDKEYQSMKGVCEKLTTVLQVHTRIPRQRFADTASQTEPQESPSESDSPRREVSKETERQGHSGREPGSEPAAEKQKATGGRVGKEAPTRKNELSQGSLDTVIHSISGTGGDAEPKVDAQQAENRSEDKAAQMEPEESLSRSNFPGREVSEETELEGHSVEVTLDPATAHPRLRLSEDRKSVTRRSKRQQLPNNPERFNASVCVLGSEGFTSGRRYWEVEVGPGGRWAIGVARDSVQRKGGIQLKPYEGIWALDSSELSQVPRKVGVYLDYEGGEVRFYNAENMALIFSRTETFTGRLVPFFHLRGTGSRISLSPGQR